METFRGTREDIARLLGTLGQALAGASDPYGIAQAIQLRAGVALLSEVQLAFLEKSRGGTGSDGIRWQPLKRETIAQRRIGKGDLAAIGIRSAGQPKSRVRGLLTKEQDKRWRQIYGTRLARLRLSMSEGEAKAAAARIAWAVLKKEGARTKLDVLGGRTVDILRDTGELFRSLTPGVEDKPSGADGQVFRTPPGMVIVGTNKKPQHHRGIPGRLPARPLWPLDGQLPTTWAESVMRAIQAGMVRAIVLLVQRGQP